MKTAAIDQQYKALLTKVQAQRERERQLAIREAELPPQPPQSKPKRKKKIPKSAAAAVDTEVEGADTAGAAYDVDDDEAAAPDARSGEAEEKVEAEYRVSLVTSATEQQSDDDAAFVTEQRRVLNLLLRDTAQQVSLLTLANAQGVRPICEPGLMPPAITHTTAELARHISSALACCGLLTLRMQALLF